MRPPPLVAGAHKPAGHRAGVLGVLEKQSYGDGAVARAVDKEKGSAFMIVLLSP
jgi:hypothetical protein